MNKFIIFCLTAIVLINTSFAEAWHHFTIINKSKYTVGIYKPYMYRYDAGNTGADVVGRCFDKDLWSKEITKTVANSSETTYYWLDSNAVDFAALFGVYTCDGRDKWVVFGISLSNGSETRYMPTYLGMTHRNLEGSKWYNGFFYVKWIHPGTDVIYKRFTDGEYPRMGLLYTTCREKGNYINHCFGPYSQMEVADKNGYNWPKMFQTEYNWQIVIPSTIEFNLLPTSKPY